MIILVMGCSFILVWILIGGRRENIAELKEYRPIQKLFHISYFGQIKELKKINQKYSLSDYKKHSLIISLLTSIIAYQTFKDIYLMIILAGIAMLLWPYFYCLRIRSRYKKEVEEALFIYTQTILLYLREGHSALQTIELSLNSVPAIIEKEIHLIVEYIHQENNFQKGLSLLEEKYPYQMIRNVNILLVGKKVHGVFDVGLIDYLQESIESHENLLKSFYDKKAANQKIFCILLMMNLMAVLMILNFVAITSNSANPNYLKGVVLLFYIANGLSFVFYERWCFKEQHLD